MRKNLILFTVSFVMFMESLDTTVINTAIPVMATSLRVSPIELKLALISYLLSLAIFIPISGWVADKYGIKRVFMTAIAVFTLSSIWCGMTNSLMGLIVARIAQGLGGSLTVPVGRLIIIRTCERHELISKMNIVIMVGALGMMSGPLLGGLITNYFSWRWIFFVNVPVGLFTLALSWKFLPNIPPCTVPSLDKMGFLLFGAGLATLTFGLATLSESAIEHGQSILMISAAIGLLFLYSLHSRNKAHPIVNISLFKNRTFSVSVLGNILSRTGFGGIPFLIPLLLQLGLGYSPQLSGLLLAPTALGVLISKPLSLPILRMIGYKRLLIINTIIVSFSIAGFALLDASTSHWLIALMTFIFGSFIAIQYTAMNSLAFANVSEHQAAAATSIVSTVQQLALSFGVAVAAILLQFYGRGTNHQESISPSTFHQTFIAMSLITFLSIIIFLRLKKEDGHELTDKPEATQLKPKP